MNKIYADLDLKALREALDIDFAHYTYKPSQCSCCYGPRDLPAIYRKKGIEGKDIKTFILFKNANNGSGSVTKYDTIKYTYVAWELSDEQLEKTCQLLQEQLGNGYKVIKPEDNSVCIIIEPIKQ